MENITFYEQKKNLFLENKRPRKPSAYVCRPELVYASLMHPPAHTAKVSETYERKVFSLMLRFETNPTSSESRSKLPISHYIKPYMTHFQNTQKILRENLCFTRNSESKREFFTKHP